jgi:hypothetical protein
MAHMAVSDDESKLIEQSLSGEAVERDWCLTTIYTDFFKVQD